MPEPTVAQAAALPLRRVNGDLHALLITSSSGRWILPKGHLEAGRSAAEIAEAEALEEAGVLGTAVEPAVGVCAYRRAGRVYRVEVFPLPVDRVLSRWKEQQRRERMWLPLEAAADQVQVPAMAGLLARFAADRARVAALHEGLRRRRTA